MLTVNALFSTTLHPAVLGSLQGRLLEAVINAGIPCVAEQFKVRQKASFKSCLINLIGLKKLSCVAPQVVDALLHFVVTFLGSISKTNDPLSRVFPMILKLFQNAFALQVIPLC